MSVPIRNSTNEAIVGSVDVLDILTFIIFSLQDKQDPEKIKQLFSEPVISAVDASCANPFIPVMYSTTLEDAIVTNFAVGIHRLPLVDEEDTIIGLCTQSNVLSYLLKQITESQNPALIQLVIH